MKDIHANFRTWRRAGPKEVEAFFNYLRTKKIFTPEKFGSFEPLKLKFQEADLMQFERILLEEKSLLTTRNKPPRQRFNITNLDRPRRANDFGHSVMASHLGKELVLQDYLCFLTDLFLIFNFEHGTVCHEDDWQAKNMHVDNRGMHALGVDLGKHLPGIYWANFFGPRYVQFFGRSNLLKAPAYKLEELDNGGFLFLTSKSPIDFENEEVKLREKEIIHFLSEEAFFSKDDPPDKRYRAPSF